MNRCLGKLGFVILLLMLSAQIAQAGRKDSDLFFKQIELRPGVTCDIHVKVFVNDQQPGPGKIVFAIPGFIHTAATWDQYAEALFAHPYLGPKTAKVLAIDLPGQGLSTPPTGMHFGHLLVEDYATAALATLDALARRGIRPSEILGHSMGTLIIETMQERLVQSGSNLAQKYGIFQAVFLGAGSPPGAEQPPSVPGSMDALLYFLVGDPVLGPYIYLPPPVWPIVMFSNLSWQLSPDTPTTEEIIARGYDAPTPLYVTMQLFGPSFSDPSLTLPKPPISPDIFGIETGTLLHTVSYVDDLLVSPPYAAIAFDYLVGCPWLSENTVVGEGDPPRYDRVHDLHISNPTVIIDAMSDDGWFLW